MSVIHKLVVDMRQYASYNLTLYLAFLITSPSLSSAYIDPHLGTALVRGSGHCGKLSLEKNGAKNTDIIFFSKKYETTNYGYRFLSSELRSERLRRSAFGKAAIGRKKEQGIVELNIKDAIFREDKNYLLDENCDSPENEKGSHKATVMNPNELLKSIKYEQKSKNFDSPEKTLERRDNALVALRTLINLPLRKSLEILKDYPRLFTDLPDLSSKISYLLNDINIKPKQLRRMIESHPRLMEAVLLDSEDNITSTIKVLQTELGLTKKDIETIQSRSLPAILSYPRSELRKRIQVYKLDLFYPKDQLKKLIWKDPRILRTDSHNVKNLLKILEHELGIGRTDVHTMLQKEILLLTYRANKNIGPTIEYLKTGEIGTCLGMIRRKDVGNDVDQKSFHSSEIIRTRLRSLVMGHPKILSSSVQKNLKPTVSFFLGDVGLSGYEFGRVIYRRGGSLLEANVDRTLRKKIQYLRNSLFLELVFIDEEPFDFINVEFKEMKDEVDIPSPSANGKLLANNDKRRLLAQMIAINPDILTLSIENNLAPKFDYLLETLGFTRIEMRHILLKRPQLLSLSLDRNIVPKIKCFLDSQSDGGLGLTLKELRTWMIDHPQTLLCALDTRIKPRVDSVVKLGLYLEKDIPSNFVTRTDRSWESWLAKNVNQN